MRYRRITAPRKALPQQSAPPGNANALELAALATLLVYFAGKAFYLAFSINSAIFPDETTWFGISKIFSASLLPPPDSPASYRYGIITHTPILYFYLMGRLLQINVLPMSDLVFLRCTNVCVVVLSVWYCWKLAKLLVTSSVARLLSIAMLTNTVMFTFMAGAVNYDNLTNLFAILSLYYLVLFLQQRRPHHFLLAAAALLSGCLTKYTLLPYALLLVLVTLYHERTSLRWLPASLSALSSSRKTRDVLLIVFCLFALGANLKLYLGNWLEFRRLIPRTDQVLTPDQAMQYRLFARGHIVEKFKRRELRLEEAQKMVLEHIHHEGDRVDALLLLQRAAVESSQRRPRLRTDRFHYVFMWIEVMAHRVYGIAAHRLLPKAPYEVIPYYLILILAGVMMIRTLSLTDLEGMGKYLIFIVAGYALILMQVQNYSSYSHSGVTGLATTGRYLFPVIAPAYILLSHYLLNSSRRWWAGGAGMITGAFFIYGEFPWFMQRVPEDWFF